MIKYINLCLVLVLLQFTISPILSHADCPKSFPTENDSKADMSSNPCTTGIWQKTAECGAGSGDGLNVVIKNDPTTGIKYIIDWCYDCASCNDNCSGFQPTSMLEEPKDKVDANCTDCGIENVKVFKWVCLD